MSIYAAGIVSSLGLTAARHASLIHSRVTGGGVSRFMTGQTTLLRAGFLPADVLPPVNDGMKQGPRRLHSHSARLIQLCHNALREAARTSPVVAPLFLAVPLSFSADPDPYATFLRHLFQQADSCFDLEQSVLIVGGRGAFFQALSAAKNYVDATGKWAVVGGVDSYCDPVNLAWLEDEKRLMGAATYDGFMPGEGAGFLLLGPAAATDAPHEPIAQVLGVATADEPGHLYSKIPCRGDGLTEAFSQVFGQARTRLQAPIQTAFLGLNGEHFPTKEWGAAYLRHRREFAESLRIEHHHEFIGDAGVALGALHVATAAVHLSQGHLKGTVLTWAASDTAQRGAALIAAGGPMPVDDAIDPFAELKRGESPVEAYLWYMRVADTCIENAAYFYFSWVRGRQGIRRMAATAFDLRRYESRMEQQLETLASEHTVVPDLTGFICEDWTYAYVCTRVGLSRGRLDQVAECFALINWRDGAHQRAVVDACVHAEGDAISPLCALLAERPERLPTLALWASRQRLPAARRHLLPHVHASHGLGELVCWALCKMRHPDDHLIWRACIHDDVSPRLRMRAAYALSLSGHRDWFAQLGNTSPSTRGGDLWLLVAMALVEGPTILAKLLAHAQSFPSCMSLLALGVLGSPHALDRLAKSLSVPRLRRYAELSLYLITGAQDEAGWQAWVSGGKWRPTERYRFGSPFTPTLVVQTMRDETLPPIVQYLASLEMILYYKVDFDFHPTLPAALKTEVFARYDAWVAENGPKGRPGTWYFAGQYLGG